MSLPFSKAPGVDAPDLRDSAIAVQINRQAITKYEIVRNVLTTLNARGDSGLHTRREIIKRVVEFEEFSTCWPDDQLKAKGLVASLREVVNVKDSFTRMKHEREAERAQIAASKTSAARQLRHKARGLRV